MNVFLTREPDFNTNDFFGSPNESLDDNIFSVLSGEAKEFSSDTASEKHLAVEQQPKLQESALLTQNSKDAKVCKKRKKMTKMEREVNKREKDRQRAKKNRDRKKSQFEVLQKEVNGLREENRKLKEYIEMLEKSRTTIL